MEKQYIIKNFLNDIKSPDKVRDVYFDLKKKLKLEKPLYQNTTPVIALQENSNHRGNAYTWETYQLPENQLLFFEIFGGGDNYALQLPVTVTKTTQLKTIDLTVINPTEKTIKTIDDVLAKYPEGNILPTHNE